MLSRDNFAQLFVEASELRKAFGQRHGQALMNALHDFDVSLYHRVTGDHVLDCFYNDDKVKNLVDFLCKEVWG